MILYRPTDGDPLTKRIDYRPRTCFTMTRLGGSVPAEITEIRQRLTKSLTARDIREIDAGSRITGKDLLLKIWGMIITVPLGIAIITESMSSRTLANIFYEIGMLQSYGKETLVIKTKHAKVPSDFVRTEYLEYDNNFEAELDKFLDYLFELPEYFERMAEQLENDPLLAIDYYRRAYLITGNDIYRQKANAIYKSSSIERRATDSVEMLLLSF
ncbi:MAG: hypothetical protein H8E40_10995 [Chloroflexi bacterium]|nr:hypothetical protein [Chloroflexota bacterium]